MISTKTKNGTPVTLTPTEYHDRPAVRVQFDAPGHGAVNFVSSTYAVQKGTGGVVGYVGSQKCLVSVPEADFQAAMTEARKIGEDELAAIRSSEKKIRVSYKIGSPLSGHVADGSRATRLLVELGVAKGVEGWGTLVDAGLVEALGEEFTFAQAEAYAEEKHRPAREQAEARRRQDAEKVAKAQEQAKATGEPVAIETRLVGETDSGHVFETRYVDATGRTSVRKFYE